MPVSVPVNPGPYPGDPGSMLHASPQQMGGHSSVSPRPASSSGMLDVGNNNGYGGQPPGVPSPLPESPITPPPPSALKSSGMANRSLSPQHLAGSHLQQQQRPNLRVVIPPGPQAGLAISSHDRGNAFPFPHSFSLKFYFILLWLTAGLHACGVRMVRHLIDVERCRFSYRSYVTTTSR